MNGRRTGGSRLWPSGSNEIRWCNAGCPSLPACLERNPPACRPWPDAQPDAVWADFASGTWHSPMAIFSCVPPADPLAIRWRMGAEKLAGSLADRQCMLSGQRLTRCVPSISAILPQEDDQIQIQAELIVSITSTRVDLYSHHILSAPILRTWITLLPVLSPLNPGTLKPLWANVELWSGAPRLTHYYQIWDWFEGARHWDVTLAGTRHGDATESERWDWFVGACHGRRGGGGGGGRYWLDLNYEIDL